MDVRSLIDKARHLLGGSEGDPVPPPEPARDPSGVEAAKDASSENVGPTSPDATSPDAAAATPADQYPPATSADDPPPATPERTPE